MFLWCIMIWLVCGKSYEDRSGSFAPTRMRKSMINVSAIYVSDSNEHLFGGGVSTDWKFAWFTKTSSKWLPRNDSWLENDVFGNQTDVGLMKDDLVAQVMSRVSNWWKRWLRHRIIESHCKTGWCEIDDSDLQFKTDDYGWNTYLPSQKPFSRFQMALIPNCRAVILLFTPSQPPLSFVSTAQLHFQVLHPQSPHEGCFKVVTGGVQRARFTCGCYRR